MKPWIIEPAKRKGYVKMTCPRADCRGVQWVPGTLKRGPSLRRYTTAPCVHCFRVSTLPDHVPTFAGMKVKTDRRIPRGKIVIKP